MKWWVVIPVGIAGLLAATVRKGRDSMATGPAYQYTPLHWVSYMEPLCTAARVSLPFAIGWIRVESGGNPCAWGTAKAKGPDGHPREQGIGQLYNPDDFTRFKVPSGALRVYCVPGTQWCSRQLNDEEMQAQAKWLMDLITRCREVAGRAGATNGLHWSGKDVYKLTKLVHGLPGLVTQGVPRVTKALGRPPRDWQEFKATVNLVPMDAGTEKYRTEFPRLFQNAENVVSTVPDDVKIVS